MSCADLNWRFAQSLHSDTALENELRVLSGELGVVSLSAAMGAQLRQCVAGYGAKNLLELGTGVGLSGLKLLSGNPAASLTSIDLNPDYLTYARKAFTQSGFPPARTRLISGDALQVMPRLNRASYDLVLIDADPYQLLGFFEQALRACRPGGTVLVPHAFWQNRVADPDCHKEPELSFRLLIQEVTNSKAVISSLSSIDDGLLAVTRV